MAATVFASLNEIRGAVGSHLGFSDWLVVTQERCDLFADATGEHQWIHDDGERARNGPFGGPIVQGDLTLSLSNLFLPQIVEVRGVSAGVNYGTGRVRYPAPLPIGSRIRAGAELVAVDEVSGGVQTTMRITIEADGIERPVCVIESLSRWLA
jgi:acyl dehydratase